METKFNFKFQICTTRSQSEALLKLGLKKETADMHWAYHSVTATRYIVAHPCDGVGECIPAWSLHRLIEMMPEEIDIYPINSYDNVKETYYLSFNKWLVNYKCNNVYKECHGSINLFSNIISMYEWLIKEGYFNKEYLV